MTTGGKPRLLGISKRGNKYLRELLVHGARAALPSLSASTTPLGKWLKSLLQRAHKNTVIVALANKLARIVWAVLRHGGTYDARDDGGLIEIAERANTRGRLTGSVGGGSEMA